MLAAVSSPPVAELVENMLHRLGQRARGGDGPPGRAVPRRRTRRSTAAAEAVTAALAQAGFDTNGLVLRDGSGLSTEDRMSTSLLGSVLAAAAAVSKNPNDVQYLRPILTGLPVAGGGGTLADRFIRRPLGRRAAASSAPRPAR